jgi:hypothetical protein
MTSIDDIARRLLDSAEYVNVNGPSVQLTASCKRRRLVVGE